MIHTDDAEKAVDWLRDNAERMAQARAERLYLEQYVKTVKAEEFVKAEPGNKIALAEALSLAAPRYLATLQAYRDAIKADEANRFLAAAAEAKIEAWRSQESTRRAEGKAY